MINQNSNTIKFWNSKEMGDYFANKPADPRVMKYLEECTSEPIKDTKVLDLGCGGGRHVFAIKKLGYDLYGCDINPQMIEYSKEAFKSASGEDSSDHILFGEILNIPFKDAEFDFVVTTGVLHQAKGLDEYKKAVSELSRVMKTGAGVSLNIFTNLVMDDTYEVLEDGYHVITKEGLDMTLLPKELFFELMKNAGLELVEELAEDVKMENTGPRVVLRANFIKK